MSKFVRQCLFLSIVFVVHQASAADFADFASLPARPELPDPLVMLDGTKITSAADWTAKRRPELKALFQRKSPGVFWSRSEAAIACTTCRSQWTLGKSSGFRGDELLW